MATEVKIPISVYDAHNSIKTVIEDLKKSLSGLDAGTPLAKSMQKALSGAESKLEQMQVRLTKGMISESGLNSFLNETNSLQTQLERVQELANGIEFKHLNLNPQDTKAIQDLNRELTELSQAKNNISNQTLTQALNIKDNPENALIYNVLSKAGQLFNKPYTIQGSTDVLNFYEALENELTRINPELEKARQNLELSTSVYQNLSQQPAVLQEDYALKLNNMFKGQDALLEDNISGVKRIKEELASLFTDKNGTIIEGKEMQVQTLLEAVGCDSATIAKAIAEGTNTLQFYQEQLQSRLTSLSTKSALKAQIQSYAQTKGALAAGLNEEQKKEILQNNDIGNQSSKDFADIQSRTQAAAQRVQQDQAILNNLESKQSVMTSAKNELQPFVTQIQEQVTKIDAQLQNNETRLTNLENQILNSSKDNIGGKAATGQDKAKDLNTSLSNTLKNDVPMATDLDKFSNNIKMISDRFLGLYQVINYVKQAIRTMWNDIKSLDQAMTNISVVTRMTNEQLWNQIDSYMQLAQQYGVTTQGVYEVSQIYYQQGLATSKVTELTSETLKMARIAGMGYQDAADGMTVALRAFNMEMSEAARVTDVYSKVASISASNSQELIEAMSKTASGAANVGSTFEHTTAMIATMVEATRESAVNIGSALKSIISRYGEMKTGNTKDENGEEIDYNKTDAALRSVGISLKDAQGQFRDFDTVIEELAAKWDTLDSISQRYIATIMAGNRQQSRFIALVSNYDRYMEISDAAENAEDAGLVQYAKTLDSLESKMNQVKTSFQQFYMTIANGTVFASILDFVNNLLKGLNKLGSFGSIINIVSIAKTIKTVTSLISLAVTTSVAKIKAMAQASAEQQQQIHQNLENQKSAQTQTAAQQRAQSEVAAAQGSAVQQLTNRQKIKAAFGRGTKLNMVMSTVGNVAGGLLTSVGSSVANNNAQLGAGISAVGNTLSGAATGLSIGGPLGAAAGALVGIATSLPELIKVNSNNYKLEEKAQKAREATESANIERAEKNDNYRNLQNLIEKLNKANETKFNSQEDYQNWIDINNQLCEAYPQLMGYMDETGNSFADASNASNLLAENLVQAANASKAYYEKQNQQIKDEYKEVVQSNYGSKGYSYIDTFRNLLVQDYGPDGTWTDTYNGFSNIPFLQSDTGEYDFIDISKKSAIDIPKFLEEILTYYGVNNFQELQGAAQEAHQEGLIYNNLEKFSNYVSNGILTGKSYEEIELILEYIKTLSSGNKKILDADGNFTEDYYKLLQASQYANNLSTNYRQAAMTQISYSSSQYKQNWQDIAGDIQGENQIIAYALLQRAGSWQALDQKYIEKNFDTVAADLSAAYALLPEEAQAELEQLIPNIKDYSRKEIEKLLSSLGDSNPIYKAILSLYDANTYTDQYTALSGLNKINGSGGIKSFSEFKDDTATKQNLLNSYHKVNGVMLNLNDVEDQQKFNEYAQQAYIKYLTEQEDSLEGNLKNIWDTGINSVNLYVKTISDFDSKINSATEKGSTSTKTILENQKAAFENAWALYANPESGLNKVFADDVESLNRFMEIFNSGEFTTTAGQVELNSLLEGTGVTLQSLGFNLSNTISENVNSILNTAMDQIDDIKKTLADFTKNQSSGWSFNDSRAIAAKLGKAWAELFEVTEKGIIEFQGNFDDYVEYVTKDITAEKELIGNAIEIIKNRGTTNTSGKTFFESIEGINTKQYKDAYFAYITALNQYTKEAEKRKQDKIDELEKNKENIVSNRDSNLNSLNVDLLEVQKNKNTAQSEVEYYKNAKTGAQATYDTIYDLWTKYNKAVSESERLAQEAEQAELTYLEESGYNVYQSASDAYEKAKDIYNNAANQEEITSYPRHPLKEPTANLEQLQSLKDKAQEELDSLLALRDREEWALTLNDLYSALDTDIEEFTKSLSIYVATDGADSIYDPIVYTMYNYINNGLLVSSQSEAFQKYLNSTIKAKEQAVKEAESALNAGQEEWSAYNSQVEMAETYKRLYGIPVEEFSDAMRQAEQRMQDALEAYNTKEPAAANKRAPILEAAKSADQLVEEIVEQLNSYRIVDIQSYLDAGIDPVLDAKIEEYSNLFASLSLEESRINGEIKAINSESKYSIDAIDSLLYTIRNIDYTHFLTDQEKNQLQKLEETKNSFEDLSKYSPEDLEALKQDSAAFTNWIGDQAEIFAQIGITTYEGYEKFLETYEEDYNALTEAEKSVIKQANEEWRKIQFSSQIKNAKIGAGIGDQQASLRTLLQKGLEDLTDAEIQAFADAYQMNFEQVQKVLGLEVGQNGMWQGTGVNQFNYDKIRENIIANSDEQKALNAAEEKLREAESNIDKGPEFEAELNSAYEEWLKAKQARDDFAASIPKELSETANTALQVYSDLANKADMQTLIKDSYSSSDFIQLAQDLDYADTPQQLIDAIFQEMPDGSFILDAAKINRVDDGVLAKIGKKIGKNAEETRQYLLQQTELNARATMQDAAGALKDVYGSIAKGETVDITKIKQIYEKMGKEFTPAEQTKWLQMIASGSTQVLNEGAEALYEAMIAQFPELSSQIQEEIAKSRIDADLTQIAVGKGWTKVTEDYTKALDKGFADLTEDELAAVIANAGYNSVEEFTRQNKGTSIGYSRESQTYTVSGISDGVLQRKKGYDALRAEYDKQTYLERITNQWTDEFEQIDEYAKQLAEVKKQYEDLFANGEPVDAQQAKGLEQSISEYESKIRDLTSQVVEWENISISNPKFHQAKSQNSKSSAIEKAVKDAILSEDELTNTVLGLTQKDGALDAFIDTDLVKYNAVLNGYILDFKELRNRLGGQPMPYKRDSLSKLLQQQQFGFSPDISDTYADSVMTQLYQYSEILYKAIGEKGDMKLGSKEEVEKVKQYLSYLGVDENLFDSILVEAMDGSHYINTNALWDAVDPIAELPAEFTSALNEYCVNLSNNVSSIIDKAFNNPNDLTFDEVKNTLQNAGLSFSATEYSRASSYSRGPNDVGEFVRLSNTIAKPDVSLGPNIGTEQQWVDALERARDGYASDLLQLVGNLSNSIEHVDTQQLQDQVYDSLRTLAQNISNAISSGMSGTLSNADWTNLKKNMGIEVGTDEWQQWNGYIQAGAEGLQLTKQGLIECYNRLKGINSLAAEALVGNVKESLHDYDSLSETLHSISELTKQIEQMKARESDYNAEHIKQLETELEIAKKIAAQQMNDPDQFNFMSGDLPDGFKSVQNVYENAYTAMNTLKASTSSGYLGAQDFYNIITTASSYLSMAGKEFEVNGMNAAQMMEKAGEALVVVDGTLQVDLSKAGLSVKNGTKQMGEGLTDGINEMAKQQVKMLDAEIAVMEVLAAMEQIGDVDVNGNGISFELGDIFTFNGSGNPADFTAEYDAWRAAILEAANTNEGLQEALKEINLNGESLENLLKMNYETWKQVGIREADWSKVLQTLTSTNWDLENLPAQLQQVLGDLKASTEIDFAVDTEKFSVRILPSGVSVIIDYSNEELMKAAEEALKETDLFKKDKTVQEQLKILLSKYANADNLDIPFNELIKIKEVLGIATGEIEVSKDKKGFWTGTFNGKTFKNKDKAKVEEALAKAYYYLDEGFTANDIVIDDDLNVNAQTKVGLNGLITASKDGSYTVKLLNREYKTKNYEEALGWLAMNGIGEPGKVYYFHGTPISVSVDSNTGLTYTFLYATGQYAADGYIFDTAEEVAYYLAFKSSLTPEQQTKLKWDKNTKQITVDGLTTKVEYIYDENEKLISIKYGDKEFTDSKSFADYVALENQIGDLVTKEGNEFTVTSANGRASYKAIYSNGKMIYQYASSKDGYTLQTDSKAQMASFINSISEITGELPVTEPLGGFTVVNSNGDANASFSYDPKTNKVKIGSQEWEKPLDGSWSEAQLQEMAKALYGTDDVGDELSKEISALISASVVSVDDDNQSGSGIPITTTLGDTTLVVGENTTTIIDGTLPAPTDFSIESPVMDELTIKVKKIKIDPLGKGGGNDTDLSDIPEAQVPATSDKPKQPIKKLNADKQYTPAAYDMPSSSTPTAQKEVVTKTEEVTENKTTIIQAVDNTEEGIALAESSLALLPEQEEIEVILTSDTLIAAISTIVAKLKSIQDKSISLNENGNLTSKLSTAISQLKTLSSMSIKGYISFSGSGSASAKGKNPKKLPINSATYTAGARGFIAFASGHNTLVGELGPELVVSNGRYFLVGENGPEMVNLAGDAIVFNHLQTQELLSNGKTNTHGKPITNEKTAVSYAKGTGSAMASASEALATLKQLRSWWQSLVDASMSDLLGKGAGGGGGGSKATAYTAELVKWYNLTKMIEESQEKITLLQKEQALYQAKGNINGAAAVANLHAQEALIRAELAYNKKLRDAQQAELNQRKDDLAKATSWQSLFFNSSQIGPDNQLYYRLNNITNKNPNAGEGALAVLERLNLMREETLEKTKNGKAVKNATEAQAIKDQWNYLTTQVFNSKDKNQQAKLQEFLNSAQVRAITVDEKGNPITNQKNFTLDMKSQIIEVFATELQNTVDGFNDLDNSIQKLDEQILENKNNLAKINQEINQQLEETEQTIYDLITNKMQRDIDKLSDSIDTLTDSNEKYIDGLQKALDKEKERYDQSEQISTREQKQRKLELLRRSGGSASEIASLEKEINSDLREEYFTNRQDQIDEIQEASDRQIEVLNQQLEIMQQTLEYQKETGMIWQKVGEILSMDNNNILSWMESAGFADLIAMSEKQQSDNADQWQYTVEFYTAEEKYRQEMLDKATNLAKQDNSKAIKEQLEKVARGDAVFSTGNENVDIAVSQIESNITAGIDGVTKLVKEAAVNLVDTIKESSVLEQAGLSGNYDQTMSEAIKSHKYKQISKGIGTAKTIKDAQNLVSGYINDDKEKGYEKGQYAYKIRKTGEGFTIDKYEANASGDTTLAQSQKVETGQLKTANLKGQKISKFLADAGIKIPNKKGTTIVKATSNNAAISQDAKFPDQSLTNARVVTQIRKALNNGIKDANLSLEQLNSLLKTKYGVNSKIKKKEKFANKIITVKKTQKQFDNNAKEYYNYYAYKEGGLVDYTGLAMVHGSEQKPESFLNAAQTAEITEAIKEQRTHDSLNPLIDAVKALGTTLNTTLNTINNNESSDSSINIAEGAIVLNVSQLNDEYDVNKLADDVMNRMYKIAAKAGSHGVTRR